MHSVKCHNAWRREGRPKLGECLPEQEETNGELCAQVTGLKPDRFLQSL